MTGYEFFKIYTAVKHHVLANYDIIKYRGKGCNNDVASYEKHNNIKYQAYGNKLDSSKQAFHFCVLNFVHNDDQWLYDSFQNANDVYLNWIGYIQAYSYRSKHEYLTIEEISKTKGVGTQTLFEPTKTGNIPPILQMYIKNKVGAEFVLQNIHDSGYNYLDVWGGVCKNDPLVKKKFHILKKYEPLYKMIKHDLMRQEN